MYLQELYNLKKEIIKLTQLSLNDNNFYCIDEFVRILKIINKTIQMNETLCHKEEED